MTRKPRQARSIATVNAIVDAGFLCLARHGALGTTTNHIAEAAGISTGSLYEYFGNKDEVYAAMGERLLADITALVKEITPTVARLEIADAIRSLARAFFDLLTRDGGRYQHLIRYILLADTREFADHVAGLLMDFVVQYIVSHPQYARVRDLKTMAYILINAGIYNFLRFLSVDNPPVSFDELIEGFVKFVTYYVERDLQLLDAVSSR